MAVRAIRGATQVDADERELVLDATRELVTAVMERNQLEHDDVISILFTATPDLVSEFPALAARGGVFLVGDEVAREVLRRDDGGPYQAKASQRAFQAVPVHGISPEDLGQGPVGDGELAEKRGAWTSSVRPDRYGIKKQGRTR